MLASLDSQELAADIAHDVTLGVAVFLVGLIAFVAVVWLSTSWSEDSAELWVAKDRTIDLFCCWLRTLVCLLVVAGMIGLAGRGSAAQVVFFGTIGRVIEKKKQLIEAELGF